MAMRFILSTLIIAPAAAVLTVGNQTVDAQPPSQVYVDLQWGVPTFGWAVTDGAQSAYRIVVASDATFGTTIWDSGAVASPSTSDAPYGGPPLPFSSALYWSVSASADGGATWSPPAAAPLLTAPDGVAWAAAAAAGGGWLASCTTGAASPSLRLPLSLSGAPITRAVAYASAQGVYTLHLNGARLGATEAVLTPGWATVPTYRLAADAFDVTAALTAGAENVLGLRLGQGKFGYNGEFCSSFDASCFAGVVRLEVEQGANKTVVDSARPGWACAPSPITFNSLFGGETYDEALEAPGWDAPGFSPPAPWAPAPRRANSSVAVLSFGAPPMAVMESRAPVAVVNHTARAAPFIPPPSAAGMFVISNSSGGGPDVWWALTSPAPLKYFVASCSPCAGVEACGSLNPRPSAWIDALPTAPVNFSCGLLPTRAAGAWNFDFGKNMAGFCTLALPPQAAAAATALALVHGEILNDSGDVDNTFGRSDGTRGCPAPGINCADQTDQWLRAAGGAATSFTPSFTFHGFRHVALFGWPAGAPAPTGDVLTCHVVHTRFGPAGGAAFNSSVLTALQAAVVRTQRSNLFSVPSDCPTREKRGWGGDAAVTTRQALLNLAAGPLYAAWTRTFVDLAEMSCAPPGGGVAAVAVAPGGGGGGGGGGGAALPPPTRPPDYVCCPPGRFGCQPGLTPANGSGFLPDVLPFDSISGWPGDFIWQSVGLVVPHTLWSLSGLLSPAERAWPMSAALLAAADREARGGLLQWGPYADWLSTEPVSRLFAENAYWVLSLSQGAELAGALGRPLDAAALTALADAVSAAMVGALFHPAEGVWDAPLPGVGGSMNAQGVALALGLGGAATANATATIVAALVADAAAHDNRPDGGVASSRWVLQGLDVAGRSDIALDMATTVTPPSWGCVLRARPPAAKTARAPKRCPQARHP